MNNHKDICSTQLNGFYRGIVMKHLSNGKCKIWIPSIYPKEWSTENNIDLLPSAEQASPLQFGASDGNGIFSYPGVGAIVWCFFERGDQNYPVYFASTLGGPQNIDSADKKESEDGSSGKSNPKHWNEAYAMPGHHPADAYVHKIHAGNTVITVNEAGYVDITTNGYDGSSCSLTLDDRGNATLQCSNVLSLVAPAILMDGHVQIDIKSPYITNTAKIAANITSPSIQLDSSAGHTAVKSRSFYSSKSPAVMTV